MKYKKIPIDDILIDRFAIEPTTFKYAKRLEEGDNPPPIRVVKRPDGLYELRDGRHRICAHLLVGQPKIKAKFKEEPVKEEYMKDKDDFHRKGLSEDNRRDIERFRGILKGSNLLNKLQKERKKEKIREDNKINF